MRKYEFPCDPKISKSFFFFFLEQKVKKIAWAPLTVNLQLLKHEIIKVNVCFK